MLTDPTNQIPGSSSNPGGSTQPSFTQMPYYPNFQPQYSNQEEQMLFHQFKMQMQMNKQQQSNQFITSQPHSGSNSTASSGSNPVAYQEFMAEQYDLDRKAKMQVLSQESEDRRRLIQAQKIAEDMKVLQIDTSGMDPTYAAIINAQKERIRVEYLPPN
ncbi:hypothetical protein Tco_0712769 [Tanacetum coccineum]